MNKRNSVFTPGSREWWKLWLLWRDLWRGRKVWTYRYERGSPFPRPLKKGRYRPVNRYSVGMQNYRERMRPGIDAR